MTIQEAVTMVDKLKPNRYPAVTKIHWLSDLDAMIYREVYETHVGALAAFSGYAEGDMGRQLLVGAPHESIYRYWLDSQIDLANAELAKYNNDSQLFNAALAAYKADYNQRHAPLGRATHFKL